MDSHIPGADTFRKSFGIFCGSVFSKTLVPVTRETLVDVACVGVLIGYFLHFALPSLRGGFSTDEMMNMYFYWQPGMLKCLWANVCFWTGFYRPGGALYYLPLYHFFLLNPEPYRIVQVCVVAASIPIVYWLSRLLTTSRLIAFLAAIIVCYHADLANVVFRGAYIYDALCGLFYFAALSYYIQIRETGNYLRVIQVTRSRCSLRNSASRASATPQCDVLRDFQTSLPPAKALA